MPRALGISVHIGWAACVVVGGSPAVPEIAANARIELLGDAERFCFHMAAEMPRDAAEAWLAGLRQQALATARAALAPLVAQTVSLAAIVAKPGSPGDLDAIFAAHPRIHTAEGCFYRDLLIDACPVPAHLVPPASLDPAALGKLPTTPWGRDQKLAALAAWRVLRK
jgi:hypothetical protein